MSRPTHPATSEFALASESPRKLCRGPAVRKGPSRQGGGSAISCPPNAKAKLPAHAGVDVALGAASHVAGQLQQIVRYGYLECHLISALFRLCDARPDAISWGSLLFRRVVLK